MKNLSLLTLPVLASLALAPCLMAAEAAPAPAQPAQPQAKLAGEPEIAICREAPMPAVQLDKLKDMEPTNEAVESILKNEKAKTTIDKLNSPIVLTSMEEALKHLTRASMEKINVDFNKQQVVIFAWQGSGQDRLMGSQSSDEEANFRYISGRTRDLRTHTAIYALPKGSSVKVVAMGALVPDCIFPPPPEPQKLK